jgi:hypothetical protein
MKSPEVWPRWNVDETDGPVSDRWTCIRPMDLYQTDGPVSDRWTCIRPMDLAGPRLVLPWMDGFKHAPDLPRTTPAPWNSSSILCSSLSDPYASEASSPFPNNHSFNLEQFREFVQFLK